MLFEVETNNIGTEYNSIVNSFSDGYIQELHKVVETPSTHPSVTHSYSVLFWVRSCRADTSTVQYGSGRI
jgi:hypothetical protein